MAARRPIINRERYDAVLFDLDGVVTKTAELHAAAWKMLFDEYLEKTAIWMGLSPLILRWTI